MLHGDPEPAKCFTYTVCSVMPTWASLPHLAPEGQLVQDHADSKELTWAMTPGAHRHWCFLLDLRLHDHRVVSCLPLAPRSLRGGSVNVGWIKPPPSERVTK